QEVRKGGVPAMSDPVKQIAMRILDLREISDYTVEQMADALQVPVEDYRRYESGEVDMPISFLVKIGEVFHVDMTEMLTGEAPRLNVFSVTRAGKGQEINRHDQYIYKNLAYNFVHRKIEPLYVTVPPDVNRTLAPNSHDGQEFDYILSGTMHMVIGKNDLVLHPGDSVYYDSHTPHAMQALGEEPVHFLAMVIP
ncbi:MAG: XRE family transcriptional regulator, partial [Clostridia bacterium]